MEMDDYQTFTESTAIYNGKDTVVGLNYTVLGLCGEAGELANKVKKINRDGTYNHEDLVKELGDVLWYVSQIANELDYRLDNVAEINMMKLTQRKQNDTIKGSGDNR